jgi:hypothetical protein
VFYFDSKPISKAEVVGIVTKIVTRTKSLTFFVDDGTDCVRCVKFINPDQNVMSGSIQIGHTVSVKGLLTLSETNDDSYGFGLRISMIESVDDLHAEIFHWLQVINSRQHKD